MKKKGLTYQSAMDELLLIESLLEKNEIPIDELAEKLERANNLVQFCQNYLYHLEESIKAKTDE